MIEERPKRFLPRIAQHLRSHDWTAAAIELAIVVTGIFLGFQVTEWNERRSDRAREQTYLLNIAQDLRDDAIEMDENRRTAESRMAALDLLLRKTGHWRAPMEIPSSRYIIAIQKVPPFDEKSGYTVGIETFILSTLDGNRIAYNTLMNGDGLDVIRDPALVRNIQAYYASVDEVRDFELSLEENRLRLVDSLQEAGISAVDGATFDEVAEQLRRLPSLRAAVENYWLYANRHVFLSRSLSEKAAVLAGKIENRYKVAPRKSV